MRKLVPVVTCDHCDESIDILSKSDAISVTVNGERREFIFDLCEEGQHLLEAQVLGVLESFSVVVPTVEKLSKKTYTGVNSNNMTDLPPKFRTCSECGMVCRTRNALGAHARRMHDLRLAQVGIPYRGGRG